MPTLFPLDLPGREWRSFAATGFSAPACGIVYRSADQVFCGLPPGNIDTGCLDLETSGLLGYCSLFNTFAPRRGPLNTPLLGVSTEGRTWVLAQDQPKEGVGEYQYQPGGTYRRWNGEGWASFAEPLKPGISRLNLAGVGTTSQIHYWGHYPVADLEFELDAPVQVGLHAWSSFLPGDLRASLMPGVVFEVHLRNTARYPLPLTLACSFPGPDPQEAGSDHFARRQVKGEGFEGVEVNTPLALPAARVQTTLETIQRCCGPLSRYGVVNYAKPDGSPRDPARQGTWDYGTYGSFPAQVNMLALLCLYEGKEELGLELAHRVWHNLNCRQGCTWEQPNRTCGEADTGEPERTKGWTDYFQSMNLWSLPAALAHQDFAGPTRPGGLVQRIIAAAHA